MNKPFCFILAAALAVVGCRNTNNQTPNDMNNTDTYKEVDGRVNFGPGHALVTTPQP